MPAAPTTAQTGRPFHRPAARSASWKMGKQGTAGNPAPAWIPNIKRQGTYSSRPDISVRQTEAGSFTGLDPENGSRVFISGFPIDVTDQQVEDLMVTIGPIHEVYMVHQYTSDRALYITRPGSSSLQKNPEVSANHFTHTGCAMVHFQRGKDAMEAWEQFHGRLLDGNRAIRVQIVLDADESWLATSVDLPQANIPSSDSSSMEVEEAHSSSQPPSGPRSMTNGTPRAGSGSHRSAQPQSSPSRLSNGTTSPSYDRQSQYHASSSGTPSNNAQPSFLSRISAAPIDLQSRIGPVDNAGTDGGRHNPIVLGGHTIAPSKTIPSAPTRSFVVGGVTKTSNANAPRPMARGKALRGMGIRRLKGHLLREQTSRQSGHTPSITQQERQRRVATAQDLDAQMEVYRQGGIMGLK